MNQSLIGDDRDEGKDDRRGIAAMIFKEEKVFSRKHPKTCGP